MIRLDLPLIGPAAERLAMLRVLCRRLDRVIVLLHGDPGCGKSQLLDVLALELTGTEYGIERHNGQSITVDLVRDWRRGGAVGNLFSTWTVKRLDEIDKASPAALAELLTWLDYLPARCAVLASTNHYAALRAISKGRVETRFKQFRVDAVPVADAVPWLLEHFPGIPFEAATGIAKGAVPDGEFDGVNLRAAVEDAESLLAEVECRSLVAA